MYVEHVDDISGHTYIHKYSNFVVGVIYVGLASARPNYTLCTGIGNGVFLGGLACCAVTEQFSVKHLHTGCYQAINPYTIMADKEMTFCTIFVNGYLRIAKVYPQSRPSMKMVGLAVDI